MFLCSSCSISPSYILAELSNPSAIVVPSLSTFSEGISYFLSFLHNSQPLVPVVVQG